MRRVGAFAFGVSRSDDSGKVYGVEFRAWRFEMILQWYPHDEWSAVVGGPR
jgi:hypothetical protein